MASAPQFAGLPIFYNDLVPLSSNDHADWKTKVMNGAPFVKNQHAVPITIDEFVSVQRDFPIIFADSDNPVPLALMGLNEGVNVFMDDNGMFTHQVYVPAYIRRYPFMLAQLGAREGELSLCFDPTADLVGPDGTGPALFENGEATEGTRGILEFCEQFEQSAMRTGNFVKELIEADLLMDGEVTITPEGADKPSIYRGFKMIDEEKIRNMRGDQLRKFQQNGMLPLIFAHLFSLQLISNLFGRQMQQGKVPGIGVA